MATSRGETLGDLLRRYRREAGLTQEELAERANLSARAVSDLERGAKLRPRRDTLLMLSAALGLAEQQFSRLDLAARSRSAPRSSADPTPPVGDPSVVEADHSEPGH